MKIKIGHDSDVLANEKSVSCCKNYVLVFSQRWKLDKIFYVARPKNVFLLSKSRCRVLSEGPTNGIFRGKRIVNSALHSMRHYFSTAAPGLIQNSAFAADLNLTHETLGNVHVGAIHNMAQTQAVFKLNVRVRCLTGIELWSLHL